MATVTRTFELSEEAAAELDRRAEAAHCDASSLLEMLFLHEELRQQDFTPEQWAGVQEGMRQAEAGTFVPREQVESLLAKYRSPL